MELTIKELDNKFNELKNYVCKYNGKTFDVVYVDGTKATKRLFVSDSNNLCEFMPRSRRKGYVISLHNISEISLRTNDDMATFRRNLKNVIKYLSKSGFWSKMLMGAQFFSMMSDDELNTLKDWDAYHAVMTEELRHRGIAWFGFDCFINMFTTPIKTMNFHSYEREHKKAIILKNISERNDDKYRWRKSYDNSYEIKFCEDMVRAWYSEEYRNCGNGHYYYLLDECHVLFGEDD